MNSKRIAFGIGIVIAVLAAFTAPTVAGPNTGYFVDQHSSAGPDEITYVEIWVNITDPIGIDPDYTFDATDVNVTFDSSIGDIIAANRIPGDPWDSYYEKHRYDDSWWFTIGAGNWTQEPWGQGPGLWPVANLTLKGVNPGTMDLHFSRELPRRCNMFDALGADYPNQTWEDGAFTCVGSPETAESFDKNFVLGWNLISLPLRPINSSTSAVLGNDTIEYDAVYRYNANSKLFESVMDGTMDPGIGYFVNVTTAGTWSYEGQPYNSMSVELKKGLNMIGWLNCTKQISGNLTSIAGKYLYNAQWNSGYEVYEPQAPEIFNDFEMMNRGNGYWIAAKEDCTLTVSCSG